MTSQEPYPVTVVIAARGGPEPATRALASLEGQDAAVLVVFPKSEPESKPPKVPAIAADSQSFSALRAEGVRRAASPVVAVLSQDYTVKADWAVVVSQPVDAEVVCGEVHPPEAGWTSRAAYLWEYAHLAPPCRPGPLSAEESRLVPAGAVVYRGRAIDERRLLDHPSELDYHARMAADGLRFYREPRLRVVYHPPPSLSAFRADRRRWSGDDAGRRYGHKSLAKRLLLAASRVALPPILLARFFSALRSKPRYWCSAAVSAPLLILFALDQTAGEVGALLTSDSR